MIAFNIDDPPAPDTIKVMMRIRVGIETSVAVETLDLLYHPCFYECEKCAIHGIKCNPRQLSPDGSVDIFSRGMIRVGQKRPVYGRALRCDSELM